MFFTADLEIRNDPFSGKGSSDSDLPYRYLWFSFGSYWLSPKDKIYYCPGCSKSFASVGLVKNLLSCSGTHSKGLSSVRRSGLALNVPELKAARE